MSKTTTQKRNRHPATRKVIAAWYAEAYDALPNNRAFDVRTLNAAIEPFIPREVNPKAAKYTFKTRMVELGRLLEIDGMLTKAEPDRAGSQVELSHLPDYLTPNNWPRFLNTIRLKSKRCTIKGIEKSQVD